MTTTAKDLLTIALSDIKSSKILYQNKQYRNSYYLFQQASEKANKAFGLATATVSPNELKGKIKHNSLKVHQKALIERKDEIEKFRAEASGQEIESHISKIANLEGTYKSLLLLEEYFRKMDNYDVTTLSTGYLNLFLCLLNDLKNCRISFSSLTDLRITEELSRIANWVNGFDSPEAKNETDKLVEILNNKELFEQFKINTLKPSARLVMEFFFVLMTLVACALITLKQNDVTRYPSENRMPERIYRKRLPIITKQPEFLDMLELAIRKMKKIFGNVS